MDAKSILFSKTLWVNLLALVSAAVNKEYGFTVIDGEAVLALLALVNIVLRLVTKQPVRIV